MHNNCGTKILIEEYRDDYTEEELDNFRKLDSVGARIDDVMNYYSLFQNDGDHATFMPVVFCDKSSIDYLEAQVERCKAHIRLLWIEKRYVRFASVRWGQLHSMFNTWHKYHRLALAVLEKAKTGKYTMQEPRVL